MLPRLTGGAWVFVTFLVWIGVNLIWIGLIEKYVPAWVGAVIATILAFLTFKYGPRPRVEEEEEEE